VLLELRGELSVVVWKVLRAVLLHERSGDVPDLFSPDVRELLRDEIDRSVPTGETDLRDDLLAATGLLAKSGASAGRKLASHCLRISRWADAQGAPRTALEYLQAASLCDRSDARLALEIGRRCENVEQRARAESWFQRAVGLARRGEDWETYVLAHLAQGDLLAGRGVTPAALASYRRAERRAGRHGLLELHSAATKRLRPPRSA